MHPDAAADIQRLRALVRQRRLGGVAPALVDQLAAIAEGTIEMRRRIGIFGDEIWGGLIVDGDGLLTPRILSRPYSLPR